MWKESATRAREWVAKPTEISRKKKTVSIARRMRILVERERPIFAFLFPAIPILQVSFLCRGVCRCCRFRGSSSFSYHRG